MPNKFLTENASVRHAETQNSISSLVFKGSELVLCRLLPARAQHSSRPGFKCMWDKSLLISQEEFFPLQRA